MGEVIKLGIAGRMRTGKTTVAKYLVEKYNFHVTGFAEAIKDVARQVGWDGNKDERGRTLLQDLGTVVRKYDVHFWIDRTLSLLPPGRHVVIDDMRMVLEHERLSQAGFKSLMMKRTPVLIHDAPPSTTGHVTEIEVDLIRNPWRVLENNGSYENLYAQIDALMKELNWTPL